MPATIFKASTVSSIEFGAPSVTGLVVNSFSRSRSAEKIELKDSDGDVVAVAIPPTVGELTIEGVVNGLTAPTVGGTLTLTGITTSGTVIVNSVEETATNEGFKTISINASEYAGTMTSSTNP
jgi:hypothetical protein